MEVGGGELDAPATFCVKNINSQICAQYINHIHEKEECCTLIYNMHVSVNHLNVTCLNMYQELNDDLGTS